MDRNFQDVYYCELRAALRRAASQEAKTALAGQPRLIFRMDSTFGHGAKLVAYDLMVELFQVSGTRLYPERLDDGWVELEVSAERITDEKGDDFRKLFLADSRYLRLTRAYRIQTISFHCFPDLHEAGNKEAELYFNADGTPVDDRR